MGGPEKGSKAHHHQPNGFAPAELCAMASQALIDRATYLASAKWAARHKMPHWI
jgi:hypothetical protein